MIDPPLFGGRFGQKGKASILVIYSLFEMNIARIPEAPQGLLGDPEGLPGDPSTPNEIYKQQQNLVFWFLCIFHFQNTHFGEY
jgi:hypothetical protein